MCGPVLNIFTDLVVDNMKGFLVTEDYICGYLVPICDEKYVALSPDDYIDDVLKDKP